VARPGFTRHTVLVVDCDCVGGAVSVLVFWDHHGYLKCFKALRRQGYADITTKKDKNKKAGNGGGFHMSADLTRGKRDSQLDVGKWTAGWMAWCGKLRTWCV